MPDIKKIKPNGEYKSGKYDPKNPDKYIGDIHNIIYRSSWEYRFCTYCDTNEAILKWSSEPVVIPYYNPLDKKDHNYNVDFYIKVLKEDTNEQEWIIEIKPEVRFGRPCIKNTRISVYDVLSWLASGMSNKEILEDYPEIKEEQIHACLAFAAEREHKTRVA
jgi:uncharacterized protein (DUF433 family)